MSQMNSLLWIVSLMAVFSIVLLFLIALMIFRLITDPWIIELVGNLLMMTAPLFIVIGVVCLCRALYINHNNNNLEVGE